jgi:hypothetical protein
MGWWRGAFVCLLAAATCAPYHATDPAPDGGGDAGGTPPPVAPPGGDDAGGDGASDASNADAADGGTFCARQGTVTFCSDFDESTDPLADWNGPNVGDGGALATDNVVFESSPHALHASTTTTGDTACVKRTFTVPKKVTVDVAFFVKAMPPANLSFGVVTLGPSGPTPLYFFFDTSKCYFQDGPDDFSLDLASPSTNAWHHLEIVVTDGKTVTTSFDGVPAWTAHAMKYPWSSPTIAALEVGITGLTTAAAADAWIDDVVVRTE